MEKLVLVLANLFARKYIPAKFQNADLSFPQSKVKFCYTYNDVRMIVIKCMLLESIQYW